MKARTHILKNITPGIFDIRKMLGVLFFILTQFVFANGAIVKNINLTEEKKKSSVVSDSIISDHKDSITADRNIYIIPKTIFVDLDNSVDVKILVVESPASDSKCKLIVKKTTPENVVKKVERNKYLNQNSEETVIWFYPSSQTNLHFSINESFTKGFVPPQHSHSKSFLKPILIIRNPLNSELLKNIGRCFNSHFIKSEFSKSFSGRAPPDLT